MKKLFLILFIVALASVNSVAQEQAKTPPPKKTPAERAENMTKRLTKELNLNEDQRVKVKAIILKREEDRDKASKELKEGPAKVKEEFKTVLTPDQFQKFELKEAEMKKKREERRKQGSPPPEGNTPPPAPEQK